MKIVVEMEEGSKLTFSSSDDITCDKMLYHFCYLLVGVGFQPKSVVSALDQVYEELDTAW